MGFNVYITGSFFLKSRLGLFLTYLSRALKSCLIQRGIKFHGPAIIYSSSDLLVDVIPAIFMKLRNPGFTFVCGMHLLAPNPFKGFRKMYSTGFKIPSLSNLYYFLSQRLISFALKRQGALVLVSNYNDRDFLAKKGFGADRILVTYGACEVYFDEKIISEPKSYDAIYIGRFHEQKGFPDLLKAWRQVKEALGNAKLAVLGEDIAMEDIKSFIEKNGLKEYIDFIGFVGGIIKFDYIKSAKVCIFPSFYESFGMVILEAMSCGVPVVAYDLPVYRRIYTRGLALAPVGDIRKMADIVIDLLKNDAKREALAEEALAMSRHFSWDKTADDILNKLGL